jgi:glycerol-3-phosphate dehydrogenase
VHRDLRSLADTPFDLVVIGGGIYGAVAAWDATQRGLSVALVEKGDFGGGTSFNNAKTLHGGVRALQSGNILELRQFVRERRILSNIAPHLVQALPFVIPTYARIERNRWLMRLYFAINDLLAHDRNNVRDPALHLPSSRLMSRAECLALSPFIDPAGVTGGIEWHDCQMYNSDRFTLSFLLSAARGGAVVANYVEATGLRWEHGRLSRVCVRDCSRRAGGTTDSTFDVPARVVLNCAGPWAPELLRRLAPQAAESLSSPLSRAMNLVTKRPLAQSHAVGGPAASRLLFMAPWRGHTIVGTSHDPFVGAADSLAVTSTHLAAFLSEVHEAFPGAGLEPADIGLIHRGLLPAVDRHGTTDLLKTSQIRDHRKDQARGLVSVLGVRYTTARDTAEQAVDLVFDVLGKTPPPCRTATTPIAGGDTSDSQGLRRQAIATAAPQIAKSAAIRLARSYGTDYGQVLRELDSTPGDARPLGPNCDVTLGEIRHAVRAEMALTLADAVLRRTEVAAAGHPGASVLRAAGAVISEELGWSATRLEQEVADTERLLLIPH